jgi:hypothetical protein
VTPYACAERQDRQQRQFFELTEPLALHDVHPHHDYLAFA